MKDKKIAILSEDPMLSRFFELEAISFGFQARCIEKLHESKENYDLIILDGRNSIDQSELSDCIIGIVSIDSQKTAQLPFLRTNNDCYDLKWPPSISEIKELFSIAYNSKINTEQRLDEGIENNRIIYYSDEEPFVVWFRSKKIRLTEAETRLLFCLCATKGEIVTRETINNLFGTKEGNIGDVYIHHLRKKLEEPFSVKIIHTLRSKGYYIDAKLQKI